jgi:hypothetical protein
MVAIKLFDSTSSPTLWCLQKSTQLFNRVCGKYTLVVFTIFHGLVCFEVFHIPNLCVHRELGEQASETTIHRDIYCMRKRSGFWGAPSWLLAGGVHLLLGERHATDSVRLLPGVLLLVFFSKNVRGIGLRTSTCIEPWSMTSKNALCQLVRMERLVPSAWVPPLGTP